LLHTGHRPELNITVLRFPGVFSEDRTDGTVHTWCTQAVERGNIFVDASEPVPFDVIYLDDVVGAIHAAVIWGGDGYTILNVGTGTPCSLTMLADEIAALVPGCVVIHNECPQPIVRLSVAKAKELLGWECRGRTDRLRGMIRSIT
jgi:nucleoside-diphosphate-sugar epimerase